MVFLMSKPPCSATISFFTKVIPIIALYLQLANPYFTHALSAESIEQEDHNHPRLLGLLQQPHDFRKVKIGYDEAEKYEPDFAGFDRSIIGRVSADLKRLGNNVPAPSDDLKEGESHSWTFPKEVLFGARTPFIPGLPFEQQSRDLPQISVSKNEDSPKSLYITLSTCNQPILKNSNTGGAKQLKLHVSTDPDNKSNDTWSDSTTEGFLAVNLAVSDDVFLTVEAPSDNSLDGIYTYELTASIDAPYAAYNIISNDDEDHKTRHFFSVEDSDSNSILLSINLTQMSTPEYQDLNTNVQPYSVFVHRHDDPSLEGISRSLCGLKKNAQSAANLLNSTKNGDSYLYNSSKDQANQRFYIKNLDVSTLYSAIIAVDGNSTKAGSGVVRGGGTVGTAIEFTTKSDENCALLFNLTFCTNVAYAVPSNQTTNLTSLASFYDDHAKSLYQNFLYSLQQIPCDTTATAKYSLARNCSDCDAAYRSWLCAVTIPRCDDFSSRISDSPWLQPRNAQAKFPNNTDTAPVLNDKTLIDPSTLNHSWVKSSRSKRIDDDIQPGPWKEVLPCLDLCYELVQSCPAALQFACPLPGLSLNVSYGMHTKAPPGKVTCNYPGKPWYSMAASGTGAGFLGSAVAAAAATSTLLLLGCGF